MNRPAIVCHRRLVAKAAEGSNWQGSERAFGIRRSQARTARATFRRRVRQLRTSSLLGVMRNFEWLGANPLRLRQFDLYHRSTKYPKESRVVTGKARLNRGTEGLRPYL